VGTLPRPPTAEVSTYGSEHPEHLFVRAQMGREDINTEEERDPREVRMLPD